MRAGRSLLILSILTRASVVGLLCLLALLPRYHNLKIGYNNARLVELADGKTASVLYQATDDFFSLFGDPEVEARRHAGMTWSIRLAGVPFTDPVAALSVLVKSHRLELGFVLGLILPLTLALLFGRVFCAYICPASLLFFTISRIRALLIRFFYLPDFSLNRGFCWGLLAGGLAVAVWTGHGIWAFILPYLSIGQTLFHGIAFGTLSAALGSIVLFSLLDLVFGKQFTCRYVCPTGRLLGLVGRKSVFSLKRDAPKCLDACRSCIDVCPMRVQPKFDETLDCSMCGECLTICPTQCLSLGRRTMNPTQHTPEALRSRGVLGSARLTPKRFPSFLALAAFLLLLAAPARAHHFKGLPHYNYFENYPQIPEEEFVGQEGPYAFSLVLYDFQGIKRDEVKDPDSVRLFLVAFNLLDNIVYNGPATLEVLDRSEVVHREEFASSAEESIYAMYENLPNTGKYSLRITLHDQDNLQCVIPFQLSSQRMYWGKWVALGLFVLVLIAAVGARKARVRMDRQAEAKQRTTREQQEQST